MKLLDFGMKLENGKTAGSKILSEICCTAARWQAELIERRLERRGCYFPDDCITVEEMMVYIEQRI